MFTKIKIKNYKSLVDLEVDLTQKRNTPKPIVLIYGENGVGKSNFANVFYTLFETLQTLSVRKAIRQFLEKKDSIAEESEEAFKRFISENFRDIESIIKNSKTKNSKENMRLEFAFLIDENPGSYLLEFDENKIVHEKLDFVLNKNKKVLKKSWQITLNFRFISERVKNDKII